MTNLNEDLFSTEEYKKILENCFHTSNLQYVTHTFKSLSGDVEGYLSEHFCLDISFKDNENIKTKSFFVKRSLHVDSFLKEFAEAMDACQKETFVYTKFFTELEKLKYFKQIFPKCYFSKETILVLEDLRTQGYKPAERLKSFNIKQCRITLNTLAHYHAYAIAYEELKSKINNSTYRLNKEFPTEFQDKFFGEYKTSPTAKFLKSSLHSLSSLIAEIPIERLPEKKLFIKLMDKYFTETNFNYNLLEKYRATCVHGDLWANNIMFKYQDNEIVDCRLIDFQILNYTVPAFDIELFFYGNTTVAFRAEHKKQLLEYYYDCFSRVLAENDVQVSDVMTYKDLEDTCILQAPESKVQAICDMSLLYLPDEVHQEAAMNPGYFKTVLIDERSKHILQMYHKNHKYRDIITSEIIDLFHILKRKEEFLHN